VIEKVLTSFFRVRDRYTAAPIIAIDIGFNSSKDSFIIRPVPFFLFFFGFLTFLVGVSVSVSVDGADSRNISDIGQGLFKICIIGGDNCFNSFGSD
jgi:hypothetical protein